MDDLSAIISQVMSDPNSVQQLQALAASLGLNANTNAGGQQYVREEQSTPRVYGQYQQSARSARPQSYNHSHYQNQTRGPSGYRGQHYEQYQQGGGEQAYGQTEQPNGNVDLSALLGALGAASAQNGQSPSNTGGRGTASNIDLGALSGMIGRLTGNTPPPSPPQQNSGGIDLSALAGILGNLQGSGAQTQQNPGGADLSSLAGILGSLQGGQGPQQQKDGFDVSTLTSMLGGPAQGSGGGMGGMDMNMLLKFQQAMSTMGATNENVRLLFSLKNHLQEDRAKKVDDAIRVMQLVQFLPLLKDSGLFGGLEKVFDGLDLNGMGLQNLLGGLGLFGRR